MNQEAFRGEISKRITFFIIFSFLFFSYSPTLSAKTPQTPSTSSTSSPQASSGQNTSSSEEALILELSNVLTALKNLIQSFTTKSVAQTADITTGLIGHWKFDEGSGTTAGDSAGSNTGTLTNGPTWTSGQLNQAINFSAGNQYIFTSSDFIGTNTITFSAWVYARSAAGFGGNIHAISNRKTDVLMGTNNRICIRSNGSTAACSANNAIPFNQWKHVVITRLNEGTVNIYVDGALSGVANQSSGTPVAGTSNVVIGNNGNPANSAWDGHLDDVRIYNRALSSTDITELYNYTGSSYPTPYTTPPPADTTPPTLSNLTTGGVTSSGATITWNTNENATSQVEYGLTTAYGNSTTLVSTLSTTHSHSLTNLTPNTTYHYRVTSTDGSSNTTISANGSFNTSAVSYATPYPIPSSDCSATNVRCVPSEYSTIQACANVAVAGDTCEVYAGTYAGWAQPTSGSSGNPITFKSHENDTVTITSRINIRDREYITIGGSNANEGFRIIPAAGDMLNSDGIDAKESDHIIIQNNYINSPNGVGNRCIFFDPTVASLYSNDNIIRNNTLEECGWDANGDQGAEGIYIVGERNLIENNTIRNITQDPIRIGGVNVVVRNNIITDMDCAIAVCDSRHHIDMIQTSGFTLSYSLLEGNYAKDCTDPTGNCHFFLVRNNDGTSGVPAADTIIARFNFGTNLDQGAFQFGGTGDNVPNAHAYNNTFAWESTSNSTNGHGTGFTNAPNGVVLNSIFYNTQTAGWSPTYGATRANYNVGFNTGYSGLWNAPYRNEATYSTLANVNPLFANYPTDGSLSPSSPLIDAGSALTTVAASDTGSGNSFIVVDSRFFQALTNVSGVQADWIAVGTTNNVAQISSINYSTNTITLATPISRSAGQSVWLYKDSSGRQVLHGSAPDIGAYEYKSGSSYPTPAYVTPAYATPAASTTPVSTKFSVGQRVQTNTNVNVRASASALGTLLGTQSSGALGTVTSGPTLADGFHWWHINYDTGADGYSAEDFLGAYSVSSTTPAPSVGSSVTYATPTTPTNTGSSGGASPRPSTSSTTYTPLNLTRTLSLGSTGSDVTELQNYLITQGYLAIGYNTGYYGTITRAAIEKYQCDQAIVCSGDEVTTGYGMVGLKTRARLSASSGSSATTASTTPSLTETERQTLITSIKAQLAVLIQQLILMLSQEAPTQ